jgi:cytochrome c2
LIAAVVLTPFVVPLLLQQITFAYASVRLGASPWTGKSVIAGRNCTKCHAIPGFSAAGSTGPSLKGVAWRDTIAKGRRNSLPELAKWLQQPSKYTPETDMPDTKLSETEARQVAGYLYGVSW